MMTDNELMVPKNKQMLVIVVSIAIFIFATVVQVKMLDRISGWNGVIPQIRVLISVWLVLIGSRKGYLIAIGLNLVVSFLAAVQVFVFQSAMALPGVVISLATVLIISIIALYKNRFQEKVTEVINEKTRRTSEIAELQEVSIMAMAALAETRDHETGRHIQRTKRYVNVLATYLYEHGAYPEILDEKMIDLVTMSAPLHDIGKVGIPDSILLKPGPLTEEEFETIKFHTALGYDAVMKAESLMGTSESFLRYAQEIILYHHEWWDGKGYLQHLSGNDIPLSARIMTVADVYDALTSKRVYKEISSHEEALTIIEEGSGTQFDPVIVDAFMACQGAFKNIADAYKDDERVK